MKIRPIIANTSLSSNSIYITSPLREGKKKFHLPEKREATATVLWCSPDIRRYRYYYTITERIRQYAFLNYLYTLLNRRIAR